MGEVEASGDLDPGDEGDMAEQQAEDVVDLEFESDDLEDLMSRANNGTSLDYELFRKTDQVDSFLRQELNSIYQTASTAASAQARNVTEKSPTDDADSSTHEPPTLAQNNLWPIINATEG